VHLDFILITFKKIQADFNFFFKKLSFIVTNRFDRYHNYYLLILEAHV